MAEKVTIMVLMLKVDLQCRKCYKKVKELLCKFPQIRDQVYNEKANTVTITVVCCSPEKIRDKLCCKGRGTIKSIDIIKPVVQKKESDDKKEQKKDQSEDKKDQKKESEDKKEQKKDQSEDKKDQKKESEDDKKDQKKESKDDKLQVVVTGYPPLYPAYGVCCVLCYMGLPGGSCYSGHGRPMPAPACNCSCGGGSVPAPPCNCGCGGRSVCYDGYYGRGYTDRRCDLYVVEENPTGCTVM